MSYKLTIHKVYTDYTISINSDNSLKIIWNSLNVSSLLKYNSLEMTLHLQYIKFLLRKKGEEKEEETNE